MGHGFWDIAFTGTVKSLQAADGSRTSYARSKAAGMRQHVLGPAEAAFISARDSFYMASIGETGWPYIQHRGGPRGFLRVLSETEIGFADFSGNRQFISVGNILMNDRVSLFLMDYANRRRLKLLGHARVVAPDDAGMMTRLGIGDYRAHVQRGIAVTVAGFDWNCPQHITPRFAVEEVMALKSAMDA